MGFSKTFVILYFFKWLDSCGFTNAVTITKTGSSINKYLSELFNSRINYLTREMTSRPVKPGIYISRIMRLTG